MSVRQMTKVWDLELDHPKQSLLMALADHADDDGDNVYPSVARLCWKTGYEERHVRRLLKELRDKDELIRLVEKGGGRGKPSKYQLTLENGVQKTPFKEWLAEHKKVTREAENPDTAHPQNPDTAPSKTLTHSPPEPSVHENRQVVEPSEEPSVSTEGTQNVSSVENRTPQQLLTDQLYQRLNETYNIQLKPKQYSFHLGSFKRILEKKNATSEECERVIAHMVVVWPKAPKVEAETALQDVRLGRDDGSAYRQQAESSTSNGYSERKPASKPHSVTDEEMGYEPTPENERMSDEEYERQMQELGL